MKIFLPLLTICLLLLKAFKVLSISWFVVFLPVLVYIIVFLILFDLAVIAEVMKD